MAKVLAVGIATLDIINVVDTYPAEDSEIRALAQRKVRGGNASNTLVVLSQLGHNCHLAGVTIDEPDFALIKQELAHYQISTSACRLLTEGKLPTSYITLNNTTGSRSIIHYRDCPEYDFAEFKKVDLSQFDWLHFEGRNIEQTHLMLKHAAQSQPHIPRSLEIEKPREGIEELFDLASLLLFSKDYALSRDHHDAVSFLKQISAETNTPATCTWGEQGAWFKGADTDIIHHQTDCVGQVVDTLAAGDTFNAAMIHSLVNKQSHADALKFACDLASHKCQQLGLHNLLAHFNAD